MTSLADRARELASFLDRMLGEYDQITDGILTLRMQYEMVSTDPHLGRMQDPRTGGSVLVQASELAVNLKSFVSRRSTVLSVLQRIFGLSSLDDIRLLRYDLGQLIDYLGSLMALSHVLKKSGAADSFELPEVLESIKNPTLATIYNARGIEVLAESVEDELANTLATLDALLGTVDFLPSTLLEPAASSLVLQ